jgi:hypothetical protein
MIFGEGSFIFITEEVNTWEKNCLSISKEIMIEMRN